MSRPKLLHVFSTFDAGGPQVRTAQLLAFAQDEFEHVIVAMDSRYGCRTRIDPALPVRYEDPPQARGPLMAFAMRQFIEHEDPALVLSYNWGAIDTALACRLLQRYPLLHHEDGFGPEEVQRRARRRSLARHALLDIAERVIVPSQVLARISTEEWGVDPARLRCIPNGIDTERFRAGDRASARRELGLPVEVRILGCVGHLRGEKDHLNLIEACAHLPDDLHVVLVGDGPERERIEARATELGMRSRLHLPGFLGDPRAAYAAFDVYVLPSRTEQMPVGLLEAMASGCLVAATDVGDVRVILPDTAQRFVVPSRSPERLASAITELLSEEAEHARIRQALRTRVQDRYEERNMCDAHCDLWRAQHAH
jgi:glycosyltransferase involved in cell wall biosynthesis